MHWKLKAFAFKVLSALPASEALHYWAQRHVTRTLPRSAGAHAAISKHAQHFTTVMAACLKRPLDACSALEFGAGRDLALALALRAHGVGRVVATDITPLAKDDLVSIAAARMRGNAAPPRSIAALRELGIEYRAPFDIRRTGLADNSFDSVISSEVLEHIDPGDLLAILCEIRRILRPGGVAIMKIDYSDHYARSDRGISRFNFLKYSEREWRRYNSGFQYVNRLRHSDYVSAFVQAGFAISIEQPHAVAPVPEVVRGLAERFKHYAVEDLFVQDALIAAQKVQNP